VVISILFAIMIYISAIAGMLIATELQSLAADGGDPAQIEIVVEPRPVAPQRDITQQHLSAQDVDPTVPPFWNR
jgi:hypothetical protein